MDARPVLGVSSLRPPLLDDLSPARSREGETGRGTRVVTFSNARGARLFSRRWGPTPGAFGSRLSLARGPRALFTIYFELEDDFDDDLDEDDDFDDDEGGDEEDSEEDDEDADTETWQVSSARRFR